MIQAYGAQKHLKITVCLDDGRDFPDVLNGSKQQLESSLPTVSVISSAACQESQSEIWEHDLKASSLRVTVPQTESVWDV